MKLRVLSFLLLLPVLAFPQEYSFKHYFEHDNSVKLATFSMFEDSRGFMWFCMSKGMHTFDGIKMRDFGNNSELLNKAVLTGIQDSKDNFWFGTTRGICKFDGTKIQNFENPGKTNSLFEDKKGNLWAASDKGLFRFYKGNWSKIPSPKVGPNLILVKNITEDSKGNLWFITLNGILEFNGSSFSWFFKDNMVNGLTCDNKDNIWFATRNNLVFWDGKSFHPLLQLKEYDIKNVFSIKSDSRSNLWLSTNKGLFRYSNHKLILVPVTNDSYYKSVFSVYESIDGVLWVGTLSGICTMTPKGYTIYDSGKGLDISRVNGITEDTAGNIWLYSMKGGSCIFSDSTSTRKFLKGKLDPSDITSICSSSDGSLWLGTKKKGSIYRLKNGKLTNITPYPYYSMVDKILEGPEGNIWCQTGKGIYYFDGKKVYSYTEPNIGYKIILLAYTGGKIWLLSDGYLRSHDNTIKIPSKFEGSDEKFFYKAIVADNEGNLWLGTKDDGIIIYNPGNKSFKRITSRQGLLNDQIVSLSFDKYGNLWIGTGTGLSELNVKEYKHSGKLIFKNFDHEDGFDKCNRGALYCDKEGNVWVGLRDKLVKISSWATAETIFDHQPGVYISDVGFIYDTTNVFTYSEGRDRVTGLPENLRLPYNKNYLKISFAGIDFRSPESVQYQYKLNGQDYYWSPLNNSNEVIFRSLEPGDYTFTVIARNKDGQWSPKPATFSFRILPPFWKTWWFYISASVFLIGIIFSYIRLRTRSLEKLVDLRTIELKEEKRKAENINSELEKSRYQLTKINELQAKWLDDLAESERYLKEVNSSKDKFFSIISHDLKSPFNALLTYSESMVENIEKLSQEELRDFTVKVSRYSRNVYNLVENLLDWSRIQTGRMEYSPKEMGILSALKEALMVHEASASKKKITLCSHLTSEIPVFADKNMVAAILNNLISNGIKFTWPGGKIDVNAVREGGFLSLIISDNGIGMEETEISRLFKIDSHFFKTGTTGEKGTGLGLILCKELIEKNGGFISVESKPGKGSSFRFTLPLA